jgi:acetyltransferase-like isoleucine patch superfamily enzyme
MRLLVPVIEAGIRAVGGRSVSVSEHLTDRDIFNLLMAKALMPLLRGALRFPLRALRGRALLLGRGVIVINSHRLRHGRFCYLGHYAYLDCTSIEGVQLGDRVTIREGAWLQLTSQFHNPGVGIRIGDHSYIGPRAVLGAAAPLEIGRHCQIGADVHFIAENHQYHGAAPIHSLGVSRRGIRIGDDCWIGNGVRILDGVSIGRSAVVGAGSVVTRDVPEGEVWVGVPAKFMSRREPHAARVCAVEGVAA